MVLTQKAEFIYKFLTLSDFVLGLRKLLQNLPEIVLYDRCVVAYPCTIRHHASYVRILYLLRGAPVQIRY